MQHRGVWWTWVVCASALVGCISRSELDPYPGGEAGQAGAAEPGGGSHAGRGGGGPNPGSGGKATAGHGHSGGRPGAGGTGGTVASGGTGGAGASGGTGESCSSAPACGGDITGSWTVASSCLEVTGVMDVLPLGLGCATAAVTGSRSVAGTFTANADGTYVDHTVTSGEDQILLAPQCLEISGTVVTCERISAVIPAYGYDSATCADSADGCLCDAVFARASGLGTLTFDPSETGSFTTSGNILTLEPAWNEPTSYEYCASAGQLTLLPLPSFNGSIQGQVVLANQ